MSTENKKKSGLSKEISFGKKTAKYPTKKTINFISDAQDKTNRRAIVWFVIFMILLVPFSYFGVYGMINKVNAAEAQYNLVQEQIDTLNAQTTDYSDVQAKYDTVVGSFLTDDEKVCINRMDIFKMIEEDIQPSATVQSITITGSQVTVVTGTTNLTTVSSLIVTLQADKRNSYVTVTTTADSTSTSTDAVVATYQITYATSVSSTTGGTSK